MKLQDEWKQVILQYAAKYPVPAGEVPCQEWTHRLCQQLKFSFPAAGWGHKSAGAGRPHSKDAVALRNPFIGWDVINGAGTTSPSLSLDGDSIDLTGQLFEEVVALDSIGGVVVPPPVEPPPPTIPTETQLLMQILAELKTQTEILKMMGAGLASLPAQINETFSKGVKIRF